MRHAAFYQLCKVSDPVGKGVVVEVEGRMVDVRGSAIADKHDVAGALFEHEREVFRTHQWTAVWVHIAATHERTRYPHCEFRLSPVIDGRRVHAPIAHDR